MSGAIAYLVILGVMFGIAMALYFGLRAIKLIQWLVEEVASGQWLVEEVTSDQWLVEEVTSGQWKK